MSQDLVFKVDYNNPAPKTRTLPRLGKLMAMCIVGVTMTESEKSNYDIHRDMQSFLDEHRKQKTWNSSTIIKGVLGRRHKMKPRLQ